LQQWLFRLYALLQVRQQLGLADHVWTDKKKSMAQNLDDLGDVFRPAMRAGRLSYIHSVYGEKVRLLSALLTKKTPWWPMTESTPLLNAMNTVLQLWMMQLACNLQ
jgi:hypothetical protein